MRTERLPVKIFFQCLIVILTTWARQGFATRSDFINQRNARFMHIPTFFEELEQTQQIQTTRMDAFASVYSRQDIELGDVPIQIFRRPNWAPQEIERIAQERFEEASDQREAALGRPLSSREQRQLRQSTFRSATEELQSEADAQVIEGVALAIANAPVETILSFFHELDRFQEYVPDHFLESRELDIDTLRASGTEPAEDLTSIGVDIDELLFQQSRIRIAGVEFSQTLRYQIITQDSQTIVAWEIEPIFSATAETRSEWEADGVLVNSGRFIIQPYIEADGTVDPSRSIMIYQIYLKIDPINHIFDVLSELFSESEARGVLNTLAEAMRRQAE